MTSKGYDIVKEAYRFAEEAHKGQKRKGGNDIPYFTHIEETASIVKTLTDKKEVIAAAYLHDVVEDCGVSAASLPVNRNVQNAVLLVTRQDGERKAKYYQQIGENPIAVMVKLIDRCHNVSQMSLAFSREKLWKYIHETLLYLCIPQ